ncbi:MAG TPA: type VII secretion target [Actinoplanes sp.]
MTTPGGADGGSGGGGIAVRPAELRTHAHNVDGAGDQLGKAADAAESVSLNGDAFGLLIGFVGGWLQEKEAELAATYREATGALRTDAANLRSAAAGYERTDQSSAGKVTGAGRGLELPL